jgi:hypothetical protein
LADITANLDSIRENLGLPKRWHIAYFLGKTRKRAAWLQTAGIAISFLQIYPQELLAFEISHGGSTG